MQNFIAEKERESALAPGLSSIVDAAEAAGWSVRRGASFVELVKPSGRPDALIGYAVNSKWWCRGLGQGNSKSFRVTAPTLLELLGLTTQQSSGDTWIVRPSDAPDAVFPCATNKPVIDTRPH
jgi:hypothetical protein